MHRKAVFVTALIIANLPLPNAMSQPAPPLGVCVAPPPGWQNSPFKGKEKFIRARRGWENPPRGQSCIPTINGVLPREVYCIAWIKGYIDGVSEPWSPHACWGWGKDKCPGVDYFEVFNGWVANAGGGKYEYCVEAKNEHDADGRWWQIFGR